MFNTKFAVLLIAFLGAFAIVHCERTGKYSDKYDDIDVDAILANKRHREQYYKCFADEAPCQTSDAKFFKEHLREAIASNCLRCTEKQKVSFDKISVFYAEKEPEKYRKIISKAINL